MEFDAILVMRTLVSCAIFEWIYASFYYLIESEFVFLYWRDHKKRSRMERKDRKEAI